MSIVKTEAFVLKTVRFGETSKIVTLFTGDYGKINAVVKGVRNYKSKICGTLESMNYINAIIYLKLNRNLQLISNAEYKQSFPGILSDFTKLESAYKIIDILNRSISDNEKNNVLFELLKDIFIRLNSAEKNYNYYVLYFQIQLSQILGLYPGVSGDFSFAETLMNNIEVYSDNPILSNKLNAATINLHNLEDIEIDDLILLKLIGGFEKFLSFHTQGIKYYNSTKVFTELNL